MIASYTVTVPPFGSLVRRAYVRREPCVSTRHAHTADVGGLELSEGPWHRASDRATPGFRGFVMLTLCGHRLHVDSEEARGAVRFVIGTVEFPSGRVCQRCTDAWRKLQAQMAPEPVR